MPVPVPNILFEVETPGVEHRHVLRLIDKGADGIHVEVQEPGKCSCKLTMPLSEVVHLMLNVGHSEWYDVSFRDFDSKGHPTHDVPKGKHETPEPEHASSNRPSR